MVDATVPARTGRKYSPHLIPLPRWGEDTGVAFLVTEDDRERPIIRLDSVGKHKIGSGSAQQNP
jgi:hypothetical protein